jgi:hypothetical protein
MSVTEFCTRGGGVIPRLRLTHRLRIRYVSCAYYRFQSSRQPCQAVKRIAGVEIHCCRRDLETPELTFSDFGGILRLLRWSVGLVGIGGRLLSWCFSSVGGRSNVTRIFEGLDDRIGYSE